MGENGYNENGNNNEEIFSKVLRAGRRTYFFDVRETRAGDYYLTITESKKNQNSDGSFFYKKHKIYLYKEDFTDFLTDLKESTDFIISQKGEEVISERHQKNFIGDSENSIEEKIVKEEKEVPANNDSQNLDSFTNVDFDEI